MKKLNNKGITLVELIVSFALVSVSVIYFYQTVYTVRSLYSESQKDTQHYVKANYALRLADEYYTTGCKEKTDYKKNVFINAIDPGTLSAGKEENFCYVTFKVDGKQYKLYKEPIVIKDASSYGYDAMLIGDTKVLGTSPNKYFSFDGDGDFIQLPDFEGEIDWEKGFKITFKARWADLNYWSRIIELGNGPGSNNLVMGNHGTNDTLAVAVFSNEGKYEDTLMYTNAKLKDKLSEYEILFENNNNQYYSLSLKRDGNPIEPLNDSTTVSLFTSKNNNGNYIKRTKNYIGKSSWSDVKNADGTPKYRDAYFKGDIYYIRIDAYTPESTDTMRTILDINANNFED